MATTVVFATAGPVIASAQTVTDDKIDPVVVTARKRSEDILRVPVAVSALTSKDIEARAIETLDDVAKFTPGLTVDQSIGGAYRSDRSDQQLIIRGMNPSSLTNPTTSIFINSVPVGTSDFLQTLDDVERVEVLKGPQSAYFGRETFAGAVNVIAKSAGNTLGGEISTKLGSNNTQDYSIVGNLPIIADKLAVRAGYDYKSHDGSYTNAANPSQTLGDQATKSWHLAITAKPIDNLTIKAFGMVFQDHDGPAATGVLLASPGSPFNQGNCTVSGTPFFCGTLPGLNSSQSPAQGTTISPTVNFANLSQQFLASPGGILSGGDNVHHFGLKRNAYHGDLNAQYDLPSLGLSITYLGGFNRDNWSEISDLSDLDGAPGGQYPGYQGFPFEVENASHDYSNEVRIATDNSKPYRGLLGISYVDAYNHGGTGVTQYGANGVTSGGSQGSKTAGFFFSLAYDILPKVTVNFDGRYQQARESAFNATGVKVASGTYDNFIPRVSIQYKPNADWMAYFTYSEGVNPGTFNSQFSTIPLVSQQDLIGQGIAGQTVVRPENLTNYEVGFKGRFFNGRATLSADIYYDNWDNQLVLKNYYFASNDPGNPYNVVGGPQYVKGNTSPFSYSFTDNSGTTTAKGIEVEANFIVFEHVTVNLAGAVNDTRYDSYICSLCLPYPQVPGISTSGKYLPNSPKDTFSGGVEYSNRAPAIFRGAEWFARGDYIYKDGVYIQSSNTVKTPDINRVNLRAGLNWSHLSAEVYIDNAFNDKAYTSGFQSLNFTTFAASAVMVGLPELITGGVRLKYRY